MTDQEALDVFIVCPPRFSRRRLGGAVDEVKAKPRFGPGSFTFVNFIVAVELELSVKFRVADVESFETVGNNLAETRAPLAEFP